MRTFVGLLKSSDTFYVEDVFNADVPHATPERPLSAVARRAASTTHCTNGFPQIGYRLLPGNRVEPQRDGITPITRMLFFLLG